MSRNLRLPQGGKIAYEVEGQGPVLVLVSGLGGRGSFWSGLVEELRQHFTTVTYDHLGTGRSSRIDQPFSIAGMTKDLVCLLDEIGASTARLVGHSTGGAILQELASTRPERIDRMVLSATWARSCLYFRSLFDRRLAALHQIGLDEYRRQGVMLQYPPYWIIAHPEQFETEMEAPLPSNVELETAIITGRIKAVLGHDRLESLPAIKAPTLVITAADDMIVPAYHSDTLAREIPGARLEVLPRGGHFVPRTEPRDYLARVLPFLLEEI
jgi:aminoacrylate hydrolase